MHTLPHLLSERRLLHSEDFTLLGQVLEGNRLGGDNGGAVLRWDGEGFRSTLLSHNHPAVLRDGKGARSTFLSHNHPTVSAKCSMAARAA